MLSILKNKIFHKIWIIQNPKEKTCCLFLKKVCFIKIELFKIQNKKFFLSFLKTYSIRTGNYLEEKKKLIRLKIYLKIVFLNLENLLF